MKGKLICKKCEGMVALSAMSRSNCEECSDQIITGHIPPYKHCDECAKKLNVCKQCGVALIK